MIIRQSDKTVIIIHKTGTAEVAVYSLQEQVVAITVDYTNRIAAPHNDS